MRHGWIVFWLVAGCFQIDLTSGKFACDRDSDCPGGLLCRTTIDGLRCVDPQGTVKDLAAPAPEPDLLPAPDLSEPDLAMEDLVKPPDLAPAVCAGEGRQLAETVWACRGNFPAGNAATLCLTGYHLCDPLDQLAAWPGCDDVPGFYASQVPIERVGEQGTTTFQIDCQIGPAVDTPWGLLGCGKQEGIRSTQVVEGSCPSLPQVMRCGRSNAWECPNAGTLRGTLAAMSHSRAETLGGGVLCCKNR